MQRKTSTWLVLGALIAIGAVEIGAQEPEQVDRRGLRRGPDVETIMQMRERLGLSEDQIAQLDVIRRESVERRSAETAELAELRSQLRAGQIRRSEVMAYMEERRESTQGLAEARWAQIESVLTEDQLATVDELRARSRPFRRGRMSDRRGSRGDVGFRGPGWGAGPRGLDRGGRALPGAGPGPGGRVPGVSRPDGADSTDSGTVGGGGRAGWRTEPAD